MTVRETGMEADLRLRPNSQTQIVKTRIFSHSLLATKQYHTCMCQYDDKVCYYTYMYLCVFFL